jgi:hypothetical protein
MSFTSFAMRARIACLALCASGATACSPRADRSSTDADSTTHVAQATTDSVRADSLARARQDSINRTLPGYVVDSILPVEEQLRRFRAQVGGSTVTSLRGGAASRDALVRRFMTAVVAGDSAALDAMRIDAREFADLIYPESPNVKPPYQQDPALVWRTIQNPSRSGLIRLVRRAGGSRLTLRDYRCDATPGVQGRNRFWTGCTVTLTAADGSTSTHRWFGHIVERDGHFKFMSYANEF